MNNNIDNQIDNLFKKARTIRLKTSELEAGFEGRLKNRLLRNSVNGASFSFWTWRLAPVMTAVLFILIVLNAVTEPQRPSDLFSPIINGYEQGQVKKYFTGE